MMNHLKGVGKMDEWKQHFRFQSLMKRKQALMSQLHRVSKDQQQALQLKLRAIDRQLVQG